MNEEWRPVSGWEGLYEVSNLGRVRSVRIRVLRPGIASHGYPVVVLSDRRTHADGRQKSPPVHQLVAAAFLGPRPDGHDINHIDGNRTNPRADNLEYLTRRDNILHSVRIGQWATAKRRAGSGRAWVTRRRRAAYQQLLIA